MTTTPELSLPEWTVLTILSQQPAHGFAIAQLTAPHAELGRIWTIPRPLIYRALGRLTDAGLTTPQHTEPGQGPQRTIYAATPTGRHAAQTWLTTPVHHIRDIRSHLLLKLALLHRTGTSPTPLLTAQRAILTPIAASTTHTTPPPPGTIDATLHTWRTTTATAALDFLDTITTPEPQPATATSEPGPPPGQGTWSGPATELYRPSSS